MAAITTTNWHSARIGATVRTLTDLEPVRAWVAEGAPGFSSLTAKSIRISKPTGTPSIFHRDPPSILTCRFRTIRGSWRREPPRDCRTMAPGTGWLQPADKEAA
jgi:hypothetical protein